VLENCRNASNIPLGRGDFSKAVFDWRQLQRWPEGGATFTFTLPVTKEAAS
jgi:hypothetical protein